MNNTENSLMEVASRIRDLREILGYTTAAMAEKTDVDEALYLSYEAAKVDLPFTFIHKCAQVFGVDMSDLLEGRSAKLSSYTVTRKGKGHSSHYTSPLPVPPGSSPSTSARNPYPP